MDCFGDQITNKNTKTYTKWLEVIAKVLNILIGLKGNNYYSKVFKRVNYKLSNSPFWVVISEVEKEKREEIKGKKKGKSIEKDGYDVNVEEEPQRIVIKE